MGWRAYDKAGAGKPSYAFGHGLSYTSFDFGKLNVRASTHIASSLNVTVSLSVKNTGSVAGKEVVQIYLAGPASSSIERPARTLEGFAKTRLLQPGEEQTLAVTLPRRSFSVWSVSKHAWLVEAGAYTITAGSSSDCIRASATYNVEQTFTWSGLQ